MVWLLFRRHALAILGLKLRIQFWRLIKSRTLSDSDRREIVRLYEPLIESRLKNVELFAYLVKRNYYRVTESLVWGLLDVAVPFDYEESGYHEDEVRNFDTRFALYHSFVFALQHLPTAPRASILAKAVSLVKPEG